jgi:hypothetical protein
MSAAVTSPDGGLVPFARRVRAVERWPDQVHGASLRPYVPVLGIPHLPAAVFALAIVRNHDCPLELEFFGNWTCDMQRSWMHPSKSANFPAG